MEEVIEHPGYDRGVLNDIAVLRLAQEVTKTFIITNVSQKQHFHFGTELIFVSSDCAV